MFPSDDHSLSDGNIRDRKCKKPLKADSVRGNLNSIHSVTTNRLVSVSIAGNDPEEETPPHAAIYGKFLILTSPVSPTAQFVEGEEIIFHFQFGKEVRKRERRIFAPPTFLG